MKRLLVGVNVVLDVLLEREPHVGTASALWAARERGACELLIVAHLDPPTALALIETA